MKNNNYFIVLLLSVLFLSCSKEDTIDRKVSYSYHCFIKTFDSIESNIIGCVPINGIVRYKNSGNLFIEREFSFDSINFSLFQDINISLKKNESFKAEMEIRNNIVSVESLGTAVSATILCYGRIRPDYDDWEIDPFVLYVRASTTQELADSINAYLIRPKLTTEVKFEPDL